MPNSNLQVVSRLLDATVEELDISPEQYEMAVRRYEDLGRWLVDLGIGDPDVYPQGSFRLGTVLRPAAGGDFDIDLVFLRSVAKESITQNELRAQAGHLLRAYIGARGAGNGNPALQERGRCWELVYTGDRFHMDVLPVIPDPDGDETAVLLSDRDLFLWQHSNPIGYADWFWSSMGQAVDAASAQLAATLSRDVDDVPRWRVSTILQRAVQLLKLHRATVFQPNPPDQPAPTLLTPLAPPAYRPPTAPSDSVRQQRRRRSRRVARRCTRCCPGAGGSQASRGGTRIACSCQRPQRRPAGKSDPRQRHQDSAPPLPWPIDASSPSFARPDFSASTTRKDRRR